MRRCLRSSRRSLASSIIGYQALEADLKAYLKGYDVKVTWWRDYEKDVFFLRIFNKEKAVVNSFSVPFLLGMKYSTLKSTLKFAIHKMIVQGSFALLMYPGLQKEFKVQYMANPDSFKFDPWAINIEDRSLKLDNRFHVVEVNDDWHIVGSDTIELIGA